MTEGDLFIGYPDIGASIGIVTNDDLAKCGCLDGFHYCLLKPQVPSPLIAQNTAKISITDAAATARSDRRESIYSDRLPLQKI